MVRHTTDKSEVGALVRVRIRAGVPIEQCGLLTHTFMCVCATAEVD